jgi:hypothetical protein
MCHFVPTFSSVMIFDIIVLSSILGFDLILISGFLISSLKATQDVPYVVSVNKMHYLKAIVFFVGYLLIIDILISARLRGIFFSLVEVLVIGGMIFQIYSLYNSLKSIFYCIILIRASNIFKNIVCWSLFLMGLSSIYGALYLAIFWPIGLNC